MLEICFSVVEIILLLLIFRELNFEITFVFLLAEKKYISAFFLKAFLLQNYFIGTVDLFVELLDNLNFIFKL